MAMPKRVGKYEIAEQIGVGGFGVVYKAWDPYIQRWVALKTCSTSDTESTQRFFREAQLAGALQHPNITLVFDFGIEDETPYFVQEFLTGTDLDELLEKRALTLEGTLAVLVQVCTGVDFAHSKGIIHRDLKPANVRVLEDGTVKIMDFGIAKSIRADSRLTQTGVALGTAGYLAPEQLAGKPLDTRTDIFSLGVMAYELIGGVRPFSGPNISNVIYQILHQEPTALRQRNPRCPERLERAIHKAIAKNPAHRFANVRELATELKDILARLSGRTQARRSETTTALVRSELARAAEANEAPTLTAELGQRPLDNLAATEHVEKLSAAARLRLMWLGLGPRRPLWIAGAGLVVALIAVAVVLGARGGGETVTAARTPVPLPTAAPSPAPTEAPAATPAPVLVAVELFIDPPSELEVDGQPFGRVQSTRLELSQGRHALLQRIPGYTSKTHEIDVQPGIGRINLTLPPYGMLSVLNDFGVPIGAVATLDGRELGALPVQSRKVAAGEHELLVAWPDGGTWRGTVQVQAGQTKVTVVAPQ